MKLFNLKLFIGAFVIANFATAKGIFGELDEKKFGITPDKSGCTAETLLQNAIEDTGINFIDDSKVKIKWTCSSSSVAEEKKPCPVKNADYNLEYVCFSDTSTFDYPYVCIVGARSESKPVLHARFSELHVFEYSDKMRSIKMNPNGCEAESMTLSKHPEIKKETCRDLYQQIADCRNGIQEKIPKEN